MAITIEDPIIGFNSGRIGENTSGFFLENASPLELMGNEFEGILADGSLPETVELNLEENSVILSDIDLLLSSELANSLDDENLAGTDIGDVRVDAEIDLTEDGNLAIVGGTTSVNFAPVLLDTLEVEVSENNTDTENVADGFDFGFSITDQEPFTLELSEQSVNHEGAVTIETEDGSQPLIENPIINFDSTRLGENTSGFFLESASPISLQGNEFDGPLADGSAPETVDFNQEESVVTLSDIDLLASSELATFVGNEGSAGTDIGDVRVDAEVSPTEEGDLEITGGTTSVSLDQRILQGLGLPDQATFGNETPDDPAEGFDFGFSITDEDPFGLNLSEQTVNHEGNVVLDEPDDDSDQPEDPIDLDDPAIFDLGGDGVVNEEDISLFASAFSAARAGEDFDAEADFNGDGLVNLDDLGAAAAQYNAEV
ncbi:MAG: hypothetical protein ACLFQP_04535 [Halothece sp.]